MATRRRQGRPVAGEDLVDEVPLVHFYALLHALREQEAPQLFGREWLLHLCLFALLLLHL